MINSFLVTLYNDGTQPTNASSVVGNVLWPDSYLPRSFTADEQLANRILFDGHAASLTRFLVAIQLLWVVEESVVADRITADDPRISYTPEQLKGQFVNQPTYDTQQISRAVKQLTNMQPTAFLSGDLLTVYRSSLSPLDKLAAVIAHFGARSD